MFVLRQMRRSDQQTSGDLDFLARQVDDGHGRQAGKPRDGFSAWCLLKKGPRDRCLFHFAFCIFCVQFRKTKGNVLKDELQVCCFEKEKFVAFDDS